LKVILINPCSKNPQAIQQKCFPPVDLLYLAKALIQSGYSVEVIDANALGLTHEEVGKKVEFAQPDLIGIPVLSEILTPVYRLITNLKSCSPNAKIVVGGPHANTLPEKVLEEFAAVDYLLKGEAEKSIVQLCQAIEGKIDLSSVKGLYFRQEGNIIANQPAECINVIDSLGFPAKDLLDSVYRENKYYMILVKERPIDSLITSRGCPFNCHFCCNTASDYRARSPENVLEEIRVSYTKGIRNFDIADANFTYQRERAMIIFEMIIKEGLKISFRFKSRTDSIDRELVEKAREAGAYLISLGLESGSQRVLERMNKGTNVEKSVQACNIVMKAGLKLNTGWIIGYPGEDHHTIQETVKLILKIRPTTANIGALIPYPGTEVYEQAKAEKTLIGNWSVKNESLPWVKLPWIKEYADLKRYVQWARRKVYYRPYYIFNFSKEIIKNCNSLLGRYALQEFGASLRGLIK